MVMVMVTATDMVTDMVTAMVIMMKIINQKRLWVNSLNYSVVIKSNEYMTLCC